MDSAIIKRKRLRRRKIRVMENMKIKSYENGKIKVFENHGDNRNSRTLKNSGAGVVIL